ncbi:tetratricopeptide repeat protein [Candidatus Methylospira mobilis]|uniref:Tetratricopeptide repeat protein n=1 Tax=Candidatus Methylospira mobilis TaxID=1808979 RepID=A0A5Q0BGB2_9GAMM|nr:cellulose biosynthesis protein BcsC [Candidatus Methylospira mobilis]QFY42172.1 tetratricopeptide repeat protein [Candidatus Methylospira mobilis]WNV03186.1 cellulose synthase subunit BcsC-related outer membrane protein [Candidatus Methylospira mobilis]
MYEDDSLQPLPDEITRGNQPGPADSDALRLSLLHHAAHHQDTRRQATPTATATTGRAAQTAAKPELAQIEAGINKLIEETKKRPAAHIHGLSLPADAALPENTAETEQIRLLIADTLSEQSSYRERIGLISKHLEQLQTTSGDLHAALASRNQQLELLTTEKSRLAESKKIAANSARQAQESVQRWQEAAEQEIIAHANTRAECNDLQLRAEKLRQQTQRQNATAEKKRHARQQAAQALIENLGRQLAAAKQRDTSHHPHPEPPATGADFKSLPTSDVQPDLGRRDAPGRRDERSGIEKSDALNSRLKQLETLVRQLEDAQKADASHLHPPIAENPSRFRLREVIVISLCSAAATLFLIMCLAFFIARSSVASTDAVIEQRTNNNRRRDDKEQGSPEASASNTPVGRLLDSARLWVVKDRLDLALEAANKARLLEPDNPAILARIGELELKANHSPQALELLQQLQSRFPDAEATHELEDAYRIATKDRMALATVDFLGRVGPSRMEPAIRALRALFPNGAPHGELGLMYYHMLGRANGHQAEAKAGLERLGKEMPNDPRPPLELAVLLVDNPATLLRGLDKVAMLTQRDDIRRESLLKVWNDGLSNLERNAHTERYFNAFTAAFPDQPVPYKQISAAEIASRRKQQRADEVDNLIRNAEAAREKQQAEEARNLLGKALQLDTSNREAQLTLAKLEQEAGNNARARELFDAVLLADPVNSRAVNGVLDIMAANGSRAEALQYAENYAQAHPQQAGDIAGARAGLLRAESDDLLKQGRNKQALSVLENGLNDIPASPWLRYDLANQYAREGLAGKAKKLFDDPAAGDVENRYAEALFLSGQGDNNGASAAIESIAPEQRSDSIKALALKSSVRADLAQAVQAQLNGKHSAAVKLSLHAETQARDTPELAWECAEGWTDINESNRALALGKRLQANAEPSLATDNALRYARLLYKAERNVEFSEKVAAIETKNNLTKQQKESLLDLKRMYAVRTAWELRGEGRSDEAEALLHKTLEQQPDDIGLLATLADILYLGDKSEEAGEIYQKLIAGNPKGYDTRLSHAKALRKMGKEEEARDEIARLGKEIPTGDRGNRLTLAEQLAEEDDFTHAREIINDLLRTRPNDKKTLLQAANIEKKAKEYESALGYLRQVEKQSVSGKQTSPEDATLVGEAALEIQKIEQRRYGYVTSGVDYRSLSGTPGMSQVTNLEAPVYMQYPLGYSGHVFVQTDYANVFAGQLDLTQFSTANQFGKINALCASTAAITQKNQQALPSSQQLSSQQLSQIQGMGCNNATMGPNALATQFYAGNITDQNALSGSINQTASGAPIAVGYKNDNWRFDIGTTPLGFPVTTVVGGVHHSGSWGKGYYSWDLARRALPNSLLSYAGAHDPVTGEVWGGVKANGGGIYMGIDQGRLGLFAQGAAHYLEGKNVQSNADIMLRTGVDWALIDQPNMRLTVGIAGMYWRFSNNQRHYTFGYGGYWSPQTYLSIAPPIQWTGRWGDLSFLFRGYAAYSWSSEGGGNYYPTSPDLQAQAQQLANLTSSFTNGNSTPTYTGSSGLSPAVSWGLRSVLEYQVAPNWFVGGRAEIARSPFYTPNYYGLYFRYSFDERTEKIPYPPEPPVPYYRY